ncbi:LPD5 domain-containing protein [Mesorhizobium sp. B2-1-2]|uniref:LPD5 domain-containing protein n=1 Tax=Mesorhizobium sp. B2-1-2 TaxID=2589973 RepID=UPI00112D9C29|nr:LPD5 domain-containing protein [Mesorhizobium sp. B2-1-2]TPN11739.1 hypothetical protein FJ971_10055 [Mesorhizobium sp. B2-1-2]
MSSRLLSDDEFFGGSAGGGGNSLLSDDQFLGGGASTEPAAEPTKASKFQDYMAERRARAQGQAPADSSSDEQFLGESATPAAPHTAESGGFIDQVKKGFVSGLVDQNPQMVGNAMDAIAELSEPDQEQASKWHDFMAQKFREANPGKEPPPAAPEEQPDTGLRDLAAKVKAWGDQGSETRQPNVPSFTSIRTDSLSNLIGDAADYAGYLIGSGVGTSAPGIAAGVAGAAATRSPLGFIASAAGPSYVQNLGDTYGALLENEGVKKAIADGKMTRKQVAGIAAEAAIPMAALDAASLEGVIGLNATGLKQTIVKRLMQRVVTGALTEGSTEGVQQVIQEAAIDVAGGDKTLAQQAVSVIDNAIGGALAGGTMSAGASHAAGSQAPEPGAAPIDQTTNIPQGAANAEALFGQESAGGAPPPPADTAAGGPPPPPAATPEEIERDRPASPRLTPEDRASPLPNNLIDDGKKIFEEALGGSKVAGGAEKGGSSAESLAVQGLGGDDEIAASALPAALPASAEPVAAPVDPATETAPVAAPPARPLSDREFIEGISPVDDAAHAAATSPLNDLAQPTEAMTKAGNYAKGHTNVGGLDVSIENPQGSTRSGVDPNGKSWSQEMQSHYGYVKGSVGSDGDHVDVFIKPGTSPDLADDSPVFVVNQTNDKGGFDETKTMLGFGSQEEADAAYHANYAKDWKGGGNIVPTTLGEFKGWLANGDTTKPFQTGTQPVEAESAKPTTNIPENIPVDVKQRVAPVQKGPRDIIQFLAQSGGVQDFKGELRAIDAHKTFVPGVGKLMREKGMPLDTAREAAAEMGYFDGKYGDRDTASQKSTVADLLDLIAETRRGNRQYAGGEQGTAAAPEKVDRLQQEVEAVAKEHGLQLTEGLTSEILDRIGSGMAVDEAIVDVLERESLAIEHETEDMKGQGEQALDEEIPFDAGPAVATGEEPSGQGRDGQGPVEGAAREAAPQREQSGSAEPDGNRQEVKPTEESGAEGKPQTVVPGAEKISQAEQAQRGADEKMKPKAPQKDAGELFDMQARGERQDDMFSAKPSATPSPQQALKEKIKAKREEATAQPAAKIDDFGEKIAGARKDMVSDLADSLSSDIDITAEPLSKVFPQPDYAKLAEAGVDTRALAFIAVARQQIPAKPRKGYKVARWAEQVRVLRGFANDLLSGRYDPDKVRQAILRSAYVRNLSDTAEVISALDPASLPDAAKWTVKSGSFSTFMGYRGPPKTFYFLLDEKGRFVKGTSGDMVSGTTLAEIVDTARAAISKALDGKKDAATPDRRTKLSIYQDRHSKTIFIGFKGQREVIRLKAGFETVKDARSYMEEHADELQATIDAMRAGPQMRRPENRPREGVDRREGDVSPETFQETFGFRGVQFGNYVEGARRQFELNEAFDGLMDLAEVLAVPPQALSLNGTLGLAFGARGRGGAQAAKAHYEPDQIVINLTKNSGAGSLAHEWFHGVDNYFGRQDTGGKMTAFASDMRASSGKVRATVWDAWRKVEKSLTGGSYSARMQKIDEARSKAYWNTMIEKAARGFEKYTVDRLATQKATNDYLANIDENAGAYPTDAEMRDQGITAAFDALFNAIETRETQQGVEMFALRRQGPRMQGIPASAVSIAPFTSDGQIKAHPDYRAAKAGDQKAAERMVADLVPDSSLEDAAEAFGTDVIYAPVIAHEASGHNAIPWTLANYYAARTGAEAATDIYQANRAFHTGATAMERLAVRATFGGDVVAGGRYVIVDDVTVMGSTLADMAGYIQKNGGEVAGVVTLANASRTGVLVAPKHRTQAIERRFGDVVRSELHLDPASLTAPEADYVLNFRDADALRSRLATALRERGQRLGAKGIQQTAEDHSEGEGRLKLAGEAFQPTDAFRAQAEAVGQRLRAELDRLGLKDIGLRISETLGLMVDGTMHAANGSYFRKLITVSLDAENPDSVLDHEVIHALRDVGAFGKDEWAIIERKSRRDWVDRYEIPGTYAGFSADVHIEEGIAHAYADWRAGRSMDGIIAKAFKKIRAIIQAIGKAFGKDFRTASDVFQQVASGEVGNRSRGEVQGEERFKLRTPRNAEEAQQTMQGMIARGQPLDRALRLPFQFFGGVDENGRWKPGLYLADKASNIITTAKVDPQGRFGWLAGPVEAARAGLIDRYGLSPEYIERDRQRHMDERAITMRGAEVLKTLADQNVGANEARVLQAILTGEAVTDKDMSQLAAPIRQAIDELGQEAVSLGLVSPESFERNRGTYLHRVYAKHEAEQNNLQKLVSQVMGRKRKQIIGDELKGRGLFWDVENARLMRDIASFKEGARGGPVLGEKFRVLDNVLSPTKDMLSGEESGKVTRRVYVPADQELPAQYTGQEWRDNGVWEVRKATKDKVTLWRDYSQAERTKMGEILDARYTIGKTYLYMAHDLATGRFYKDIAENEDWASSGEPATKWVEADQRSRFLNDREVAWVKVPDTTIANTGGKKRWGALSGKWVRSEIWRDLNEIEVMNRPSTWRMLLSQWKLNKTSRSPVVHMNNVMSNMVLMDMNDVRMQDLQAGLRSFISKDKHWQDANEHGVFGADMMTQEIRDNVLKPILDEIEKQGQDGTQNSFLARAGVLGKFADRLWTLAKTADRKMIDLYRVEDDVFRLASYRAGIARGESPEHAAAAAREQFLDYDIRAPWVNAARNSLLPFISYTYRAVPLIARAMATRPWKLAKYAMIAYALNALAYAWDDDGDQDKERASLRDEEQGYTWLGTPRMLRMPFRNGDGLPVFLDIRRWIPGGDVFDTNQGSSAVPIPAPLQFGGPLMLAFELALNKSSFTGDPITNDLTDNWWDKTSKVGDYLWKAWLPSAAWVPNSWYWSKIGNAINGATDAKGRPYSLPEAVSSSFGVKMKPQDVETGLFWHYKDIKYVDQALRAEARTLARQRERGLISQKAFDAGMQALLDKRDRLVERVKEMQRAQKK